MEDEEFEQLLREIEELSTSDPDVVKKIKELAERLLRKQQKSNA